MVVPRLAAKIFRFCVIVFWSFVPRYVAKECRNTACRTSANAYSHRQVSISAHHSTKSLSRGKSPMSGRGSGLHFIIVDPASDPSPSQRIREVRSHAGRWTWQQGRRGQSETADGVDTSGDDNAAQAGIDNRGQLVLTHRRPPAPTPANRPSPSILDPFQTYVPAMISMETVSVNNKYCTPVAPVIRSLVLTVIRSLSTLARTHAQPTGKYPSWCPCLVHFFSLSPSSA
jgi:hypothetical protein